VLIFLTLIIIRCEVGARSFQGSFQGRTEAEKKLAEVKNSGVDWQNYPVPLSNIILSKLSRSSLVVMG